MSCRGLSCRGFHPVFGSLRCRRNLPPARLYSSNRPGTSPFTEVLATTASTPPISACFTFKPAPGLYSYNRRKSLYTGMTPNPPSIRLHEALRRPLTAPDDARGTAPPHVAGMWPRSPFFRLAFCQLQPSSGEPALTSKCSQPPLLLPAFPPVLGRKSPPTCLLSTDANPCTRVIHQIRPQTSLRRPRKRFRRELDGPGQWLAAMELRRAASRVSLGDFRPKRWNQPLRKGAGSHWQPRPRIACPMWQRRS